MGRCPGARCCGPRLSRGGDPRGYSFSLSPAAANRYTYTRAPLPIVATRRGWSPAQMPGAARSVAPENSRALLLNRRSRYDSGLAADAGQPTSAGEGRAYAGRPSGAGPLAISGKGRSYRGLLAGAGTPANAGEKSSPIRAVAGQAHRPTPAKRAHLGRRAGPPIQGLAGAGAPANAGERSEPIRSDLRPQRTGQCRWNRAHLGDVRISPLRALADAGTPASAREE